MKQILTYVQVITDMRWIFMEYEVEIITKSIVKGPHSQYIPSLYLVICRSVIILSLTQVVT